MELKGVGKKIVLISSGQPSLNPRLVKEADALTSSGYDVTVLYAYWNAWGTDHDKNLLSKKNWKAICVAGAPRQKPFSWFFSRLIYKTANVMLLKTGNYRYLSDLAIARSSYYLIRAAKKHPADLYIAHNLGALPAVIKTAKLFKKPFGFDAEDFHRQEVNDDKNSPHFKICAFLEDKYLPRASYLTASSPQIAQQYTALYQRKVTCILNTFPKIAEPNIIENHEDALRIFWFSQTLGPNRGLETIIAALALTRFNFELHLLGQPAANYQTFLFELANKNGINREKINFHAPVPADELFNFAAKFDIGIASETGFCLNNSIALSNKLFTYIQSGLAVMASNTAAQNAFLIQHPESGKSYSDANELAIALTGYHDNRHLLINAKRAAFELGQNQLNWETESVNFLKIIEAALLNFSD